MADENPDPSADFERMAREIDSQGFTTDPAEEGAQTSESPTETETEGQEPDKGKEEVVPGKQPEPEPEKPEGEEPEVRDSNYVKAQKDKDRLEKNWQKQQEIAEQNRKDREQLEADKAQLAREKEAAKPQVRETSDKDDQGYTAEDYDQAYEGFLADGQSDQAKIAKQRAQDCRVKTFQRKWADNVSGLMKDNPELNDAKSPLRIASERVLEEIPVFKMIPNGAAFALRIAKAEMSAGSGSGLQNENQKLKAEIQRLNEALSIDGSGPAKVTGDKAWEDADPKEQLTSMEQLAEELDRMGIA